MRGESTPSAFLIGLNSSAFGPGQYLLKIDGLTWKGQVQDYAWVMLGLE